MSPSLIIVFSILVAVAATIGAALLTVRGYTDDIAKTEGDLANLALSLSEKTELAFQAIETVQKDILEKIARDDTRTVDDLDRVAASQQMHAILSERTRELPQVSELTIVNAAGLIVGTSLTYPLVEMNFERDKSYFEAFTTDPALTAFLSEPLHRGGSTKKSIVLARKIKNPDGNILGILVANIDIGQLEKLCPAPGKFPTATITLYRRDGVILAHHPKGEAVIGQRIVEGAGPLSRLISESTQTVIRDVWPGDKKERLIALHALSHYPIGVAVSETVAEILSGRRLESYLIGFIAFCMDIAVGIACLLGFRKVRTSILRAASETYLARHDVLTKLPNRMFFVEELRRTIRSSNLASTGFSVCLIDINKFKDINDNFGHPAGDQVIQTIARRLRGCLRRTDFIARIGGDEFAIIQKPVRSRQDVVDLATGIQTAMRLPMNVADKRLVVDLAIGIAVAPTHGRMADELMKAADLALDVAKADPAAGYRFYDAEIKDRRLIRRALDTSLRQAVENNEFELFYQPILDLATNRIWGCEALIRWKHPTRGLLSPMDFIPLAEETGLIGTIGDWVLKEACRTAVSWSRPLTVSVNLSPVQFKRRDVFSDVKNALAISGLPSSRLALEVTETVHLDDDATTTLRRLKSLGVSISLDDFGTGYASMSYLSSFPFDKIKIDRSFVRDMMDSPDNRAIIKATIALARDLKMTTTAEGVETEEQLKALRQAGASLAQGFLIARPMTSEALTAFMRHGHIDNEARPNVQFA